MKVFLNMFFISFPAKEFLGNFFFLIVPSPHEISVAQLYIYVLYIHIHICALHKKSKIFLIPWGQFSCMWGIFPWVKMHGLEDMNMIPLFLLKVGQRSLNPLL